ncbi:MAG: class I SAM-dependent methyltransferase [Desulfobacterales bacterium]|nr:class I SAM-dependent methyltransferase [Deltaproteobacteria bacterium]NNL41292.1 class I SAM-dependent methyltransferase [Desulfobacterales bacterium]
MAIDDAFNKSVDYYDTWVQKALPCYDELFSVAIESVPFPLREKLNVLDLGAGTGLFSWHVFQKYKNADFTLIDVAEKMLDVSKERFADFERQFSYITSDYRKALPKSQFDLIISSLSIHHLDDNEKQDLFKKIFSKLTPGGAFINVDQIKAPSKHFQELYWSKWLAKVRQTGASEDQIQESIIRRKEFDKDSTLTDQFKWLKKAGFNKVDCLYKHYFVGVFFAQK